MKQSIKTCGPCSFPHWRLLTTEWSVKIFFFYFPCLNSVSLNVIDKWRGQLVITVVLLWCDRRNVRGMASVLLQNIIPERSNNSPFIGVTLTTMYSVLRPSFPLPAIDSVFTPLLVLCTSGSISVNRQYSYPGIGLERGVFIFTDIHPYAEPLLQARSSPIPRIRIWSVV